MAVAVDWNNFSVKCENRHYSVTDLQTGTKYKIADFWNAYHDDLGCNLTMLYRLIGYGMSVEAIVKRPRTNKHPHKVGKRSKMKVDEKKADYLRTHLERFGNTVISAKHSKEDIEQILDELGISAEIKWSEGESDRFGSTGGCWVIERKIK